MIDEPDAVTLLEAMAATLTAEVLPATSGGAKHSARVVANLCRILARDLSATDDDTARALDDLLGRPGTLTELIDELDRRIAAGSAPAGTLDMLLADAARRAEIAKPGYTDDGSA